MVGSLVWHKAGWYQADEDTTKGFNSYPLDGKEFWWLYLFISEVEHDEIYVTEI